MTINKAVDEVVDSCRAKLGVPAPIEPPSMVEVVRDTAATVFLKAQLIARELGPCREVSCAVTRMEEAAHWLDALARRLEAGAGRSTP